MSDVSSSQDRSLVTALANGDLLQVEEGRTPAFIQNGMEVPLDNVDRLCVVLTNPHLRQWLMSTYDYGDFFYDLRLRIDKARQKFLEKLLRTPGPHLEAPDASEKTRKQMKACKFCSRNGESEIIVYSHSIRDDDGNVTCPILRKFVCPLCSATGSKAHTLKYCSEAERVSFEDMVKLRKAQDNVNKRLPVRRHLHITHPVIDNDNAALQNGREPGRKEEERRSEDDQARAVEEIRRRGRRAELQAEEQAEDESLARQHASLQEKIRAEAQFQAGHRRRLRVAEAQMPNLPVPNDVAMNSGVVPRVPVRSGGASFANSATLYPHSPVPTPPPVSQHSRTPSPFGVPPAQFPAGAMAAPQHSRTPSPFGVPPAHFPARAMAAPQHSRTPSPFGVPPAQFPAGAMAAPQHSRTPSPFGVPPAQFHVGTVAASQHSRTPSPFGVPPAHFPARAMAAPQHSRTPSPFGVPPAQFPAGAMAAPQHSRTPSPFGVPPAQFPAGAMAASQHFVASTPSGVPPAQFPAGAMAPQFYDIQESPQFPGFGGQQFFR